MKDEQREALRYHTYFTYLFRIGTVYNEYGVKYNFLAAWLTFLNRKLL